MLAISLSEDEYSRLRKKPLEEVIQYYSKTEDDYKKVHKKKDEKWVAIRIYSQPEELMHLSMEHNNQFEEILHLYFTDIREAIEQDEKIYRPFNKDDYKQVIDFVEKHKDADKLFVHCAMGVCRSAGVVHGLGRKYDWVDIQHGLKGNTSVYPYPNVVEWFVR